MLPITFLTFAMGYLAIIGFPRFSGFWSKDKIIETALAENWVVGLCALLGAGITGFYMTRLMLMTFFTDKRWEKGVHPHESPKVMTIPLIVLAALSVLGGVLLARRLDRRLPRARSSARRSTTSRRSRRWPSPLLAVVGGGASASRIAWFLVGKQAGAARGAAGRLLRDPGGAPDLYGDAINEAARGRARALRWSVA